MGWDRWEQTLWCLDSGLDLRLQRNRDTQTLGNDTNEIKSFVYCHKKSTEIWESERELKSTYDYNGYIQNSSKN